VLCQASRPAAGDDAARPEDTDAFSRPVHPGTGSSPEALPPRPWPRRPVEDRWTQRPARRRPPSRRRNTMSLGHVQSTAGCPARNRSTRADESDPPASPTTRDPRPVTAVEAW